MLRTWIILLSTMLILTCTGSQVALAQADPEGQTAEWNRTAQRAEDVIGKATASTQTLEDLRAEIAAQRTEAFAIISQSNVKTLTLQAQLNALGPPPAQDDTEPEFLAKRRAELLEVLAEAGAPTLAARQAYNRAEVLISEIDKLIRSHLSTRLFERSPSPLVPTRWLPAASELVAYAGQVASETRNTFAQRRIPLVVIATLAALFLLLFIQPRFVGRFEAYANMAGPVVRKRTYAMSALALRLFIPAIAGALLLLAFLALNISSFSARSIVAVAISIPFLLIVPYWFGHLLFSPTAPGWRVIDLDDNAAAKATRMCLALGVVLVAEISLEAATKDYVFSSATRSVLSAIVVLAGSIYLWRLARILINGNAGKNIASSDRDDHAGIDFLALVAHLVQLAALAALAAVVIGYVEIARQAVLPSILSLGLIGFALVVHRLIMFFLHAVLGGVQSDERAMLSLAPLAIGFLVLLATLPVFALIWGARQADISEIWLLLTQGVDIGGTRISLGVIFILVAVFVIGLFATRWLQRLLGSTVLPKTKLDSGGRNAIVTGLGYVGMTLSALIAISMAGLDLSNLAIVAGALSVGIGFGLQAIVSNFVSGIILLIERPIKEGDWIEVSGNSGIVRKIAVRSTRIETFDHHEVIVPNSDLIASAVTNMTLSSKTGRLILPVGVAYGSDLEKTRKILLDVARNHKSVARHPEPAVLFMGLGESSLDFELRCFLSDVYSIVTVRSELLFDIYRELSKAGIEIPFPQHDISLRNVDDIAKAIASLDTKQGS